MFDLIFNKDDSSFFYEKIASTQGAPQDYDARFRFAIHPQEIRQFHDNCQIAKCQTVATLTPVEPTYMILPSIYPMKFITTK